MKIEDVNIAISGWCSTAGIESTRVKVSLQYLVLRLMDEQRVADAKTPSQSAKPASEWVEDLIVIDDAKTATLVAFIERIQADARAHMEQYAKFFRANMKAETGRCLKIAKTWEPPPPPEFRDASKLTAAERLEISLAPAGKRAATDIAQRIQDGMVVVSVDDIDFSKMRAGVPDDFEPDPQSPA